MIDVGKGKLKVCIQDDEVSFNVFEAMKLLYNGCFGQNLC